VIEWNATSHGHAYDLWEKAILSDGGAGCQKLCDMSGEPLIQGMLVGTSVDLLTTEQTHQVRKTPFPSPPLEAEPASDTGSSS
jgi:amidase